MIPKGLYRIEKFMLAPVLMAAAVLAWPDAARAACPSGTKAETIAGDLSYYKDEEGFMGTDYGLYDWNGELWAVYADNPDATLSPYIDQDILVTGCTSDGGPRGKVISGVSKVELYRGN